MPHIPDCAVAPVRRFRAPGRRSARGDGRGRRSPALRRDGQPLRSQSHRGPAGLRGDQAARHGAHRRPSDGEAGRPHRRRFRARRVPRSSASIPRPPSTSIARSASSTICGCKAGLVFNPATPLDWLDHTLDKLDLVLIMSVNPGFGGQSFIAGTRCDKLTLARKRIDAAQQRTGRKILLEVDGGVKVDNIARDREGRRRHVRRGIGDLRRARLSRDDREDARGARRRAMTLAGCGRVAGRADVRRRARSRSISTARCSTPCTSSRRRSMRCSPSSAIRRSRARSSAR